MGLIRFIAKTFFGVDLDEKLKQQRRKQREREEAEFKETHNGMSKSEWEEAEWWKCHMGMTKERYYEIVRRDGYENPYDRAEIMRFYPGRTGTPDYDADKLIYDDIDTSTPEGAQLKRDFERKIEDHKRYEEEHKWEERLRRFREVNKDLYNNVEFEVELHEHDTPMRLFDKKAIEGKIKLKKK